MQEVSTRFELPLEALEDLSKLASSESTAWVKRLVEVQLFRNLLIFKNLIVRLGEDYRRLLSLGWKTDREMVAQVMSHPHASALTHLKPPRRPIRCLK